MLCGSENPVARSYKPLDPDETPANPTGKRTAYEDNNVGTPKSKQILYSLKPGA